MTMALRQSTMAITFAGGISTDQDSKQVPQVKLLDLQNAVFTQDTTLKKRHGYRALGRSIDDGGSTYSGAKALGKRDDELITFTSGGTYSYRPIADAVTLTGNPLSIASRERTVAKTGTEQSQCDAGTNNGVTVVAWRDSRGGIWWEVREEGTGRVLRAESQLALIGSEPRVVPAGTGFVHIYFADHAATSIWVAVVDTYHPTVAVVPSRLVSDLYPGPTGYDVCATSLDQFLGGATPASPPCIAWPISNTSIRVGYVDPSGVLGSGVTGLPPAVVHTGGGAVGCNIGVAYSELGAVAVSSSVTIAAIVNVFALSASLTVVLFDDTSTPWPGASLQNSAPVWSGTRLYVVFDDGSAPTPRDNRIRVLYYDSAAPPAVVPLTPFPIRGLALASRAFVDNGIPYVFAVHDVAFFTVYLLIRLSDGAVVARHMPTIAHGQQASVGSVPWTSTVSVDPTDARRWRVALLYNEQLEAISGQFAETGIRWVVIDFDDPNAWQSVQLGSGLYLAGACPQHYDGNRWAEAGFHYAPDGPIDTVQAVDASGMLTAGLRVYQIWYEETDSQGEIHRGPVSIGIPVTMSGENNQVTITGPMYRATSRRRVRVCIARTQNLTSEGADVSSLFEVTSRDVTTAGSPNGYILNDPTTDTWTFVDRMSDEALAGQNPIYTTGGIISNDPAPMAGGVIAVGKGRIFFTDPTDPTMVRYTQQLQEGFAVEFAERLKQKLDPSGGDVTAIGIMDGAVYPFRENAVYVVGGPGPLPNPTVSPDVFTFTPGELVTSDVGCTQPRSIADTPVGLTFKSAKGVRLIGRDRRVIDIGSDVRAYDAQDVVSATLTTKYMRIIFLTSSGSTLMYDYQHEQWSRYTNHAGLDALILGDLYHYLRPDGRVFQETPNAFRDDNSHIPMVLELAWLKMAGYLQGWQRIWYAQFLGEWRSRHVLRIRYRLNYELQWTAPIDLDVNTNYTATPYGAGPYGSGPYGSTGSSVYQRRIHIGKPCQAIQFQIQDVEATDDYGASFELSELVLTGGIKGNLYKLEATRSN